MFSVVADTINIIGIVVQRPVRVMFEMVVNPGSGRFLGGGTSYAISSSLAVLRKHHIRSLQALVLPP
jgi:hypothetical protein